MKMPVFLKGFDHTAKSGTRREMIPHVGLSTKEEPLFVLREEEGQRSTFSPFSLNQKKQSSIFICHNNARVLFLLSVY